jgi:hypothetical protein
MAIAVAYHCGKKAIIKPPGTINVKHSTDTICVAGKPDTIQVVRWRKEPVYKYIFKNNRDTNLTIIDSNYIANLQIADSIISLNVSLKSFDRFIYKTDTLKIHDLDSVFVTVPVPHAWYDNFMTGALSTVAVISTLIILKGK